MTMKYISDVIREIEEAVDTIRKEGGYEVTLTYSVDEDNDSGRIEFVISLPYRILHVEEEEPLPDIS